MLACFALSAGVGPARAQSDELPAREPEPASGGAADEGFGPILVIEKIEVTGNRSTAARLIRRALPVREGEVLRAGDPRLRAARFKVLALGYFREVELELRKGSSRGKVVLLVTVVERGTIILDRLYFGTTRSTPWWAGLALTERNLLGTGIGVGGGLVYAGKGDIEGDHAKYAFELHAEDPSILGSRFGAHAALLYTDTREPYRVGGSLSDLDPDNFRAFPYTRLGVKGGMSVNVTPLSRLTFDGRVERVRADPPLAPTRLLEDGTRVPVDLGLRPGTSRVVTASIGFDRDTRADPVLPYGGDRLVVLGEFGATFFGGTYDYASALARYQHWWPVHTVEHVLSLHVTGGLVLGNAPLFDRIHVSDMNRMLTPRALGLVVSTRTSRDFLGTSSDEVTYGCVAGAVEVEYSYRLFRSRKSVYGGDLFAGVGLWGLAMPNDLQVRDRSLYRALPIDLVFDAGLRLDTEIGIFELTLANALGRVPF
jgi:outer membrane protein assembly factor BamA